MYLYLVTSRYPSMTGASKFSFCCFNTAQGSDRRLNKFVKDYLIENLSGI